MMSEWHRARNIAITVLCWVVSVNVILADAFVIGLLAVGQ